MSQTGTDRDYPITTIELYNDAEQMERATIKISSYQRDELFRLKGYLEGVGAPKSMQAALNNLLDLTISSGVVVGKARLTG